MKKQRNRNHAAKAAYVAPVFNIIEIMEEYRLLVTSPHVRPGSDNSGKIEVLPPGKDEEDDDLIGEEDD